jgi:superfamily II DNA or RNA helicase
MNRLLQGEVGSGKTVVAALAAYAVFLAGAQGAIMAPTEILAEQHHRNLLALAERWAAAGLPTPTIRLLTAGVTGVERAQIYAELAEGSCQLVVGTHALIQEEVAFRDLAFVVIDEQQRFGVLQRAALRGKGYNPHVLVMTATPIPPHPGPHPVWGSGSLGAGRDAPWPAAGAHPLADARGAGAGLRLHPPAGGAGPSGLYHLSAGGRLR